MPACRSMLLALAQAAAGAVVAARLARGRRRRPPLAARRAAGARERRDPGARRGGADRAVPGGLAGDPDVGEVIVVDDGSRDAHRGRRAGARRARGGRDGARRAGSASRGRCSRGSRRRRRDRRLARRRHAPAARAAWARWRARSTDADLVTASARFACDGAGERLLHPSMLASLVYRYGPSDAEAPAAPGARARQRPGDGGAARGAAGGRRLRAGGGAHDRRRGARAGAGARAAGGSRSSTGRRSSTCGCTRRRARRGASGAARSRCRT